MVKIVKEQKEPDDKIHFSRKMFKITINIETNLYLLGKVSPTRGICQHFKLLNEIFIIVFVTK